MAADQLNLEKVIRFLQPHCAGFHLDVMDNHFVPNMTWGADTVNAIAQASDLVWVHLMIDNPVNFYHKLVLKPDSLISFHIESKTNVFTTSKIIKEKKHRLSIAISPKTPLSAIFPFLNVIDQVLVMSVEPGFSGQPFLKEALDRIFELIAYRNQYKGTFSIGVDGGVNAENIVELAKHGVVDYAVGGAIFRQENYVKALKNLKNLME
jgi:ribulose-phosphate 3-epimerase